MKEKLKKLTELYGIYDYWKKEVSWLEKKDINFIMTDFDATLFSRDEQLEKSELIRSNRWYAWRKVMINEIWLEKYINDWIIWRELPTDIISQMDPGRDIILTAWIHEHQIAKIKACWFDNFKIVVTPEWEDKILATIRYVIFELWYIPRSITIFEDKPEHFIEYRDLIEDVLWTKLIIKKVVMNGNSTAPSIETI